MSRDKKETTNKFLRKVKPADVRYVAHEAFKNKQSYIAFQAARWADKAIWGELNKYKFLNDIMSAMTDEEIEQWKDRLYPIE